MDPLAGRAEFMPPSGHVAGIWARNDDTRGVHKAPANEVVRGVISLETQITKGEHDQLNPVAVNCIRSFPGQGIRIWGARTLSSDPEWRYLNVRRLFNFVEESILQGTNWVVFEPNDPKLWDSVKRTVTMFLRRVWRDGALFGRTPAEAFFVKCDEENNPPENRDAGILTVEIGDLPREARRVRRVPHLAVRGRRRPRGVGDKQCLQEPKKRSPRRGSRSRSTATRSRRSPSSRASRRRSRSSTRWSRPTRRSSSRSCPASATRRRSC